MGCFEYLRKFLETKFTSKRGKREHFRHSHPIPRVAPLSSRSKRLDSYMVAVDNDALDKYHRRHGR
jgi:hypothetical protein